MLKQELARELLIFVKFHKTQGAVWASESTVNRGHVAKKEIIPKSCSEQSAGMPECVRECACIVRLKAYWLSGCLYIPCWHNAFLSHPLFHFCFHQEVEVLYRCVISQCWKLGHVSRQTDIFSIHCIFWQHNVRAFKRLSDSAWNIYFCFDYFFKFQKNYIWDTTERPQSHSSYLNSEARQPIGWGGELGHDAAFMWYWKIKLHQIISARPSWGSRDRACSPVI